MSASPMVTVHELSRLDSHELHKMLGDQVELQESRPLQPWQQGDAAVFNLIASATPWVAGVVGLWLLKPRKGKTTRRKLTRIDESGNVHEAEIFVHEYASESPSDTVVNALAKLFGLGTDAVKTAIDQAAANAK